MYTEILTSASTRCSVDPERWRLCGEGGVATGGRYQWWGWRVWWRIRRIRDDVRNRGIWRRSREIEPMLGRGESVRSVNPRFAVAALSFGLNVSRRSAG